MAEKKEVVNKSTKKVSAKLEFVTSIGTNNDGKSFYVELKIRHDNESDDYAIVGTSKQYPKSKQNLVAELADRVVEVVKAAVADSSGKPLNRLFDDSFMSLTKQDTVSYDAMLAQKDWATAIIRSAEDDIGTSTSTSKGQGSNYGSGHLPGIFKAGDNSRLKEASSIPMFSEFVRILEEKK